MVQFNPNLNVGKTAKLNSSAQVGKAGEVENKQPTKVTSQAVWIGNNGSYDKYQPGDVVIDLTYGGTFRAYRYVLGEDGLLTPVRIDATEISRSDFESERGDIRNPDAILGTPAPGKWI